MWSKFDCKHFHVPVPQREKVWRFFMERPGSGNTLPNLTLPASLENITSSQVMLVGSPCKDHCRQRWQRIKTERIRLPEWLSGAEFPCRPGELTWDRSVRKKEKSLSSLAIKFFLNLFLSLLSPLLAFLFLLSCYIKAHPPKVFWEKKVNVLRHWMSETVFKRVNLIYSLVG